MRKKFLSRSVWDAKELHSLTIFFFVTAGLLLGVYSGITTTGSAITAYSAKYQIGESELAFRSFEFELEQLLSVTGQEFQVSSSAITAETSGEQSEIQEILDRNWTLARNRLISREKQFLDAIARAGFQCGGENSGCLLTLSSSDLVRISEARTIEEIVPLTAPRFSEVSSRSTGEISFPRVASFAGAGVIVGLLLALFINRIILALARERS